MIKGGILRRYLYVLVLFAAACSRPSQERSIDLTVPVTVSPATLSTIESTITATGTLRAVREAPILSEVKGNLSTGSAGCPTASP